MRVSNIFAERNVRHILQPGGAQSGFPGSVLLWKHVHSRSTWFYTRF